MAEQPQLSAQVDASVNRNDPDIGVLTGANIEPVSLWWMDVLGVAPVDTGATPFPTVPASFPANAHYYPGMGRSYVMAGYIETPSHTQIQMATQDIQTIQLTIRQSISPDVLARWQLALSGPASIT
jgi:hypothetical protein